MRRLSRRYGIRALSTATTCTQCGTTTGIHLPTCPECPQTHSNSLKPPEKLSEKSLKPPQLSHFAVLDLAPTYLIDLKDLENKYKRLQMRLHPDKHANSSETQKNSSLFQSQQVNEAFSVLKNPVKRALYMLEWKYGIDMAKTMETDLLILTESMELRELCENAKGKAGELEELKKVVKKLIGEVEKELAAAIGDTAQLDRSVKTAVRMRYLEKVLEEIDNEIHELS